MFLDEKLKTITTHLAKSVGVFLELAPQFDVMHRDQMFIQISSQVKKNKLDVRAQFNYALLLYSTGKMLEKVGLKDRFFPGLLEFFCNVVTQQYKNSILTDTQPSSSRVAETPTLTNDMTAILIAIVTSATKSPIEVCQFFVPKFYARACGCGEVFGFKVTDALEYLGKSNKGLENALKKSHSDISSGM
ncbi:Hypothetical predicted protein [Paramuricea clavata]|uniref:Uncharacterized protein n=1 Tax=Paramuricea clavata TaxID=317549 RepID=A0A7D9E5U7_PARCT|nr:Hypothetical predicted protein [Paramuricea clavata]